MTEELKNLELIANENIELAQKEKNYVKQLNITIINELKRAKARKEFAQKELKLNIIREDLIDVYNKLIKKKKDLKEQELLGINDKEIEIETDFSKYLDLIAKIQSEIAQIQFKIAENEIKIANKKSLIAYERNYIANERFELSNKINDYIKAVRRGKSEKKISKLQDKYLTIQETLIKNRKDIFSDLNNLKKMENELIDLKKDLSTKLIEREKIRPKLKNL
ncbi:MAG: hypothetical protein ACFFAH_13990 [Promethearchaeota archaeon]